MNETDRTADWTLIVTPRTGLFEIPFKEIWRYRDLLVLLVRRDFVALYKQTILGPLWFFIQPVLTTVVFVVIFGNIARIPTDGLPTVLFYLAGITCWNYFSESLVKTSETFTANTSLFGKVYFPRIIMPLSVVISNLLKFSIQLLLFLGVWSYYLLSGSNVRPNSTIALLPLLLLLMAGLGLGLGMIFTSMTTKYRDLRFLLAFGVQLLMYVTPVIYSAQSVPDKYRLLILANPLSAVVETFKYAFLGRGVFEPSHLLYSFLVMVFLLFMGLLIFNRTERFFMDTV